MATNYDFLNLPKSKPGSSTAYGESLLAGKIKRSEEKAKSAEKFGKILTGLKVGVKGAKWWMDEKIDDFHRGNSTVYANLQGLLDSSANILTQNQEIIKSGKSYEDYFYSKAYTDIIKRLIVNPRTTNEAINNPVKLDEAIKDLNLDIDLRPKLKMHPHMRINT